MPNFLSFFCPFRFACRFYSFTVICCRYFLFFSAYLSEFLSLFCILLSSTSFTKLSTLKVLVKCSQNIARLVWFVKRVENANEKKEKEIRKNRKTDNQIVNEKKRETNFSLLKRDKQKKKK